jgi:hypothetical protein
MAKVTERSLTYDTVKELSNSLGRPVNYNEVKQHILENELHNRYGVLKGKTPEGPITACLSRLCQRGDLLREKKDKLYHYYLPPDMAPTESYIESKSIESVENTKSEEELQDDDDKSKSGFKECDLHLLLSTYLRSNAGGLVDSKTISHEISNRKDKYQRWIHPDMVGVRFNKFESESMNTLSGTIDVSKCFELSSYELKKSIDGDADLKEKYFQALSNSSWANYGWLVAFEINPQIKDEMIRLSSTFGIGIIRLGATPGDTQIISQARHNSLDFTMMNKLCVVNSDFKKFIDEVSHIIDHFKDDKVFESLKSTFEKDFCEKVLISDDDDDMNKLKQYCEEHGIPMPVDEEENC